MPPKPPDLGPLLASLNNRRRWFVEAYWRTGHTTEAAALAGYAWPSRRGSGLNSHPVIKAVLRAFGERLRWEPPPGAVLVDEPLGDAPRESHPLKIRAFHGTLLRDGQTRRRASPPHRSRGKREDGTSHRGCGRAGEAYARPRRLPAHRGVDRPTLPLGPDRGRAEVVPIEHRPHDPVGPTSPFGKHPEDIPSEFVQRGPFAIEIRLGEPEAGEFAPDRRGHAVPGVAQSLHVHGSLSRDRAAVERPVPPARSTGRAR